VRFTGIGARWCFGGVAEKSKCSFFRLVAMFNDGGEEIDRYVTHTRKALILPR